MKELEIILKNIKNKELLPIYFFYGEEPYYIDVAVKHFENEVLTEDEKVFNQTVVYGKDTTYSEVLALARQFPMMGDKQLIVLKEAQDIRLTEKEIEVLEAYVNHPVPSTILVIAHKHKKVDSRKKFAKTLAKNKMLFLSEPVKDWNLPQFIQDEISRAGLKAEPNIPTILAEYLGNDLSRIANEINKLKLILKEGEVLNSLLVEKHIGISKDYNVFELQKALGTKNEEQAMKIAYYIGKNPKSNPFVMMLGSLYNYFSNLIVFHSLKGMSPQSIAAEMGVNPYFIKDYETSARLYPLKHATRIISILREFDMKSKGLGAVNMTDAELLKEMVYKILNVDKTKVKV
ncbi:DNA polymerase III subunit delta [Riemerella anatipestifer]|uniref:DNA polymerase III subunit delta n=1 Tax=Riemerella anatipestifer TaxID=34085 RepID=UPI002EA95796|nr:DNA polymerase III subunit delta [Riemerella anatipestifer]